MGETVISLMIFTAVASGLIGFSIGKAVRPRKVIRLLNVGLLGQVIALKAGITDIGRGAYLIIEEKWDYASGRADAFAEAHDLISDPDKLEEEARKLLILPVVSTEELNAIQSN